MHQRGYVHWAKLPNDKRRPVLILSPNARNQRASDVIVAPISSVLRDGPWHVRLRKGEAGVAKTSIIKCEQLSTIHKDFLSEAPAGTSLTPKKMKQVERAILVAVDILIPEY